MLINLLIVLMFIFNLIQFIIYFDVIKKKIINLLLLLFIFNLIQFVLYLDTLKFKFKELLFKKVGKSYVRRKK